MGGNPVFVAVFKATQNDYTEGKLFDLLTDLIQSRRPADPPKVIIQQHPVAEMPDVVRITYERGMTIYKECSHLHAQLKLLLTDEERLISALKILDNMDEVERCWKFHDEWKETGIVPVWDEDDQEQADFTSMDKASLIMERQRHMVHRSKLKSKMEKGGKPEQISRWQSALVMCQGELDQINQLLEVKTTE